MYCLECKTEEGTPHLPNCKTGKLPLQTADEHMHGSEGQPLDFDGAAERVQRLIESRQHPEMKADSTPEHEVATNEQGDCYDEDTGEYLGLLSNTQIEAGQHLATLPAQISVFYEGYWYIFKPQSRYKEGETNATS